MTLFTSFSAFILPLNDEICSSLWMETVLLEISAILFYFQLIETSYALTYDLESAETARNGVKSKEFES